MSSEQTQDDEVEAQVAHGKRKEVETNLRVGAEGRITVPEYIREEYDIDIGDRIDAVFYLGEPQDGGGA